MRTNMEQYLLFSQLKSQHESNVDDGIEDQSKDQVENSTKKIIKKKESYNVFILQWLQETMTAYIHSN